MDKIYSVFVLLISVIASSAESMELIQVQILSRHGLRSPEFPFPTDAYADQPKYWPNGWGQLLELGKQQEFELGRFIRRRYGNFLSGNLWSKETFAMSSDYDRTIQSAQLVLAGLYDKGNGVDIDSFVPVHSIPKEADRMINPNPNCPRRKQLYDEFKNSAEVKQHYEKYEVMFESILQKMGYRSNETMKMYHGIGALMIQRICNLTIPAWAEDLLDSDDFMRIISQAFRFLTGTDDLKRLTTGPLLSYIVDGMKRTVDGMDRMDGRTEDRKLYLYLGHDITVANMINTLSTFEIWPTFSATLFFELLRNTTTRENFIRVLYKNETTSEELTELKLLKCSSPCTLEKFTSGYQQFLPTSAELDVECSLDQTKLSTLDAVLIGVVVGLVLVLLGVILLTIRRKPKRAYEINA